jgi:hypothetical protein
MPPIDFMFRAALVGVGVLVVTLAASVPMVAVYAHVINPGQPQSVYDAAALWIAPWSSHIVGPLSFLWWNYRGALKRPNRPAIVFALAGIAWYVVADLSSVALFDLSLSTVLTPTFFISLAVKTTGALLGARYGQRKLAPAQTVLTPDRSTDG